MLTYIIIFIAFIVGVSIFQKFQKKSYSGYAAAAQVSDPFKSLAETLGLQYESFTPKAGGNVLYSSGSRISGTYQNVPIEAIYAMSTQSESGIRYAASYTMQKTITFQVQNSAHKEFQILPKSLAGEGGAATGNSRFDALFSVIGNVSLPASFLEYCAQLGWMNLSLKGGKLLFNDSFYDEMKGMQMMSAVHPIWKSSPTQTAIDLSNAKRFFDEMAKFSTTL